MAQMIEVDCVNKPNRSDPHSRIENLGGPLPSGGRWRHTEDEVIAFIEGRQYVFFTKTPLGSATVIVAIHNGRKYLKTTADSILLDNLLSLRECDP